MKLLSLIAAALVATGSAQAGEDDHKPMHGGIVAHGKVLDMELVASPTWLRIYVSDHGKPLDMSKASGKLTLLAGAEKQEIELKPSGDKLEAAGSFKVGPGTKAVAAVSVAGKTATARFTLK